MMKSTLNAGQEIGVGRENILLFHVKYKSNSKLLRKKKIQSEFSDDHLICW